MGTGLNIESNEDNNKGHIFSFHDGGISGVPDSAESTGRKGDGSARKCNRRRYHQNKGYVKQYQNRCYGWFSDCSPTGRRHREFFGRVQDQRNHIPRHGAFVDPAGSRPSDTRRRCRGGVRLADKTGAYWGGIDTQNGRNYGKSSSGVI